MSSIPKDQSTSISNSIYNSFTDINLSGSSSVSDEKPDTNSISSRPASVNLFDIHLGSLINAPKLKGNTSSDYEEWKSKFEMWSTSVGAWDMISKLVEITAKDADDY